VPVVVVNPGAARLSEVPVTAPTASPASNADVQDPHDLGRLR
jgi:hypothetical protein